MKKSFLKKALVMAGAALLALPLALGTTNTVEATDEGDTTTQNVILTKYGFPGDQEITQHDTDKEWNPAGAEKLDGVTFEIYDVTANYWKAPKDYKGALDGAKLVATKTTGADTTKGPGTLEVGLPKLSTDDKEVQRLAVYLFRETNPRAGYNTTDDFWLTVDKPADDGNVYVYPKNQQKTTFHRTFIKKDSATDEVLPGADFVIKNNDGKFLQITDKDGIKVENSKVQDQNGFVDVLKNNYRIAFVDEDAATTFTSASNGQFGLNGFEDKTTNYTAIETHAPDGYEIASGTPFTATDKNDIIEIKDAPKGLLPHTGGAGIILFVVLGAALVVLGGVAYNKRRTSF